MLAVELKEVTKVFSSGGLRWLHGGPGRSRERVALDSVSLSVSPGETLCVAGGNGSGKTTLLDIVAARSLPTEGAVRVYGHDVEREAAAVRRLVSLVTWNRAEVNPRASGLSNLMTVAAGKRVAGTVSGERIQEAVEALNMSSFISDPVHTYSAGSRYLLAIARSILAEPQVLAIDDLFDSLDPSAHAGIQTLLLQYAHDYGGTLIFTTRRVGDAKGGFADSVAILDHGSLRAVGPALATLPAEPPAQFRIRLRGPSEVVLSAVGAAGQVTEEDGHDDRVTVDVRVEGDSAFLSLLGKLLRQGYEDCPPDPLQPPPQ